jgi:DNA-binding transcriptional ArsR family regulator
LYVGFVTTDEEKRADAFFHALADSTRRDILRRVLAGEHSVSALARHYPMSFAAVQKHVAVLERAGLVTKRRSGREQLASGDVEAVRAVTALLRELEHVWRGRIARIDELLDDRGAESGPDTTPTPRSGPTSGPTQQET